MPPRVATARLQPRRPPASANLPNKAVPCLLASNPSQKLESRSSLKGNPLSDSVSSDSALVARPRHRLDLDQEFLLHEAVDDEERVGRIVCAREQRREQRGAVLERTLSAQHAPRRRPPREGGIPDRDRGGGAGARLVRATSSPAGRPGRAAGTPCRRGWWPGSCSSPTALSILAASSPARDRGRAP